MLFKLNKLLNNERISCRVYGGYEDIEVRYFLIILEPSNLIIPVLE